MTESPGFFAVLIAGLLLSCGDPKASRLKANHKIKSISGAEDPGISKSSDLINTLSAYRVVAHSIPHEATSIDPQTEISVTLNMAPEESMLSEDLVYLKVQGRDEEIPVGVSIKGEGSKTLLIRPRASLKPGLVYQLTVTVPAEQLPSNDAGQFSVRFLTSLADEPVSLSAKSQNLCQITKDHRTRCLSVQDFHEDQKSAVGWQVFSEFSPALSVETGSGAVCIITMENQVECLSFTTGAVKKEPGLSDIVSLKGSEKGLCALDRSGLVSCKDWGQANFVQPAGLGSGVLMLGAGGQHYCAVLAFSGELRCWGANESGQGSPEHSEKELTAAVRPVSPLNPGEQVENLALGMNHSCLLTKSGKVRCWGGNALGQLGSNNFQKSDQALDVSLPESMTSLASGSSHVCATSGNGAVFCWGWNAFGQLGSQTSANASEPVLLKQPEGISMSGTIPGQYFSLIRSREDRLFALGTFISDLKNPGIIRLPEMQPADHLNTESP